jgi:hypothetical protein
MIRKKFKLQLSGRLMTLDQNLHATKTPLLSTGTRSSATSEIAINIEVQIFIALHPLKRYYF